MLTLAQAVFLGLLQGATELFPISSLGHSVLVPALLGWNVDQGSNFFLVFLVATHLATALVLLGFFWRDWVRIITGFFRSLKTRDVTKDYDARLAWLLIVGTIPAGLTGLLLEKKIKELLGSPHLVAIFLILNGLVLLFAESRRRAKETKVQDSDQRIAEKTGFGNAFFIGLAQSLALLPGFSRSGASMSGGLLAGLNDLDAARFAFLLATPVIFAAGALKLPHAVKYAHGVTAIVLAGALAAAFAAYISVRFLVRYFENRNLKPFGAYCIVFGVLAFVLLGFKG